MVQTLKPGDTQTLMLELRFSMSGAPPRIVTVEVDPSYQITESNELNNRVKATIRCPEPH